MMRPITLLFLAYSVICSGIAIAGDEKKKQIAYFSLKPSLISNVQGKAKHARIDVQLMTQDAELIPDL